MGSFFKQLISEKIDDEYKVSSKRFLAIFVFTPAVLLTIFLKLDISYVYALLSTIGALLGLTSVEKFSKNFKKTE